jgi:hypothetical protein
MAEGTLPPPSDWERVLTGIAVLLTLVGGAGLQIRKAMAANRAAALEEKPDELQPEPGESREMTVLRREVARIGGEVAKVRTAAAMIPTLVHQVNNIERRTMQLEEDRSADQRVLGDIREATGYAKAKLEEFCDRFERVEDVTDKLEKAEGATAEALRALTRAIEQKGNA